MTKSIDISIIVPSYNESAEIKLAAIESIAQFLKDKSDSYEVLIVDDASTNDTREVVKKAIKNLNNFKLIENSHGGKAITVMTGLLSSQGKVALFTDMDQATPIDQLPKLISQFKDDTQVVIGVRQGRPGAPLVRRLMSKTFTLLRNLILGLPFSDTQCGFKAFSRSAIDQIFPKLLKDWQRRKASGAAVNAGFDIETLFVAKKLDIKTEEVVVKWHHVQNEKQVQVIQDSLAALADMWRIRLADIQGKYNHFRR